MEFMNKEDRQKVEQLNSTLGTKHRTKPYDFKNPDDIIEATIMATAEYADMTYYSSTVEDILNKLDESMEIFYPAEWVKHHVTDNKDFKKADLYLGKAGDALDNMMDTAEKKCSQMWSIIFFDSPDIVRNYFFGDEIPTEKKIIKAVLKDRMLEVVCDIDYNGVVEDSAEMFAKALKEKILLYEKIGICE